MNHLEPIEVSWALSNDRRVFFLAASLPFPID